MNHNYFYYSWNVFFVSVWIVFAVTLATAQPVTVTPSQFEQPPVNGDNNNNTTTTGECYSNLTLLFSEVASKDPYRHVTYVLCPHTVFEIGEPSQGGVLTYTQGSFPLFLRKKTSFLCGTDGKSSNNCTLRGGTFQIMSNMHVFADTDKNTNHNQNANANRYTSDDDDTNPDQQQEHMRMDQVLVQGLTLERSRQAGAILAAPGNVTFRDCIFQNHRNASGAIVLSYYYYNEDDTNNNPQDTLDDSKSLATPRQAVTLEGCRLEGNSFVSGDEENSLGLGGIIQVGTEYNDLALRECIFWNNSYNNDAADIETAVSSTSNDERFAIHVAKGSTIAIADTCFLDNNFVGRGAIVLDDASSLVLNRNTYGTVDSNITCPFVSFGSLKYSQCIEYSSTNCFDGSYSMNRVPGRATSASWSKLNWFGIGVIWLCLWIRTVAACF